jgi:hypothetical protein
MNIPGRVSRGPAALRGAAAVVAIFGAGTPWASAQTEFTSAARETGVSAAGATDLGASTAVLGPWAQDLYVMGREFCQYEPCWAYAYTRSDVSARRLTANGLLGGVDNVSSCGGSGWGVGRFSVDTRFRVEPGERWYLRVRVEGTGFGSGSQSFAELRVEQVGTGGVRYLENTSWNEMTRGATDWSLPLEPGEHLLRFRGQAYAGGASSSRAHDRFNLDFELTTTPGCRVDYTRDGELTFDDIAAFVQRYNDPNPIGGPRGCAPSADLNMDREATFDDIALFVTLYTQGC